MSGPADMVGSIFGTGGSGETSGVGMATNSYQNDPVNTKGPYGSVTYEKGKDREGNTVWNQVTKLSPAQQYKQDALDQASLAIINAILGYGNYTGKGGVTVPRSSSQSGLVDKK